MDKSNPASRKDAIQAVAVERGCSLRTAAKEMRSKSFQSQALNKQATEVAAHVDWGNQTDIAPEIRELAEVIATHGVRHVSNTHRNRILKGLPLSVQVNRK